MASFDAMLSIIPTVLIFVYLFNLMAFISKEAENRSLSSDVFDKLIAAADYTVKSGAVMREGGARYPNWMDEKKLTERYSEDLRISLALSSLYISSDPYEGDGTCIYRLVVFGDEKDIGRLFVCGD